MPFEVNNCWTKYNCIRSYYGQFIIFYYNKKAVQISLYPRTHKIK